ncbi:MAG: uracil-DNA glycosylase family protein [bacterium]|nr:uracil-DNA glycosylase family protein [bacterium]
MDIEQILVDISKCQICKNLEPWHKFSCDAHGQISSKYFLVSEAPGYDSVNNKKYWTGRSGKIIRNELSSLTNRTLEDIFYLTDIVKCQPFRKDDITKNRTPLDIEINNCYKYFVKEIKCLKPKFILIFGSVVWNFLRYYYNLPRVYNKKLTEIHKSEGFKIVKIKNINVTPLLHPSNANRFMEIEKYKSHLREVFKLIIDC